MTSDAPKIKLYYFDMRGRAEVLRLIMAQAQIKYEDIRFTREDWPKYKPSMPLQQAPVLEYNGEKLAQSMTIARFLAREYGLYGKDNWEGAKADMVVDTVVEMMNKVMTLYLEKDEAKKKELHAAYSNEVLPGYIKILEEILEKNGGKFFVGTEVTYADIVVVDFMNALEDTLKIDWRRQSPIIANFSDKIFNLPNIKEYVSTRPQKESE